MNEWWNKVYPSEQDKEGNFKESFHPANVLRWIYTICAIGLLAWMMG